jgi:hypothetical protein
MRLGCSKPVSREELETYLLGFISGRFVFPQYEIQICTALEAVGFGFAFWIYRRNCDAGRSVPFVGYASEAEFASDRER